MTANDRRAFLRSSIAAVAAGGTLPSLLHLADGIPASQAGLQLYTVRDEMEKDLAATLRRVAQIGYREVEFAGYFGKAPREVRDVLQSTGLSAPAAHIGLAELRQNAARHLADAALIGHRYVVVAWIDEKERTADGLKRVADDLNGVAEVARESGIAISYHNHDFEFRQKVGSTMLYDLLLERLDPSLVTLELDLYWVNKGGQDPLRYFAKYPGRFHLVHVKDMKADGSMADVGAGTLPFATYFARHEQAGIRHFFVEHDEPGDAFASIARSYRNLRAIPL